MSDPSSLFRRLPSLTREQTRLIEALRARDGASAERYRLADIYFGAVLARSDQTNPERLAHSAQSMRELLDKLTVKLAGALVRINLPDVSAQLNKIKDSYNGARNGSKSFNPTTQEWSGEIDTPVLGVFREIERAIEHGKNFLSKKERSKRLLKTLPLGQAADPDTEHAFAKRWSEYDSFFHTVAHHDAHPGDEEYGVEFDGCTQMLLEQLRPPVSDVLTALDHLVDEAEGDA